MTIVMSSRSCTQKTSENAALDPGCTNAWRQRRLLRVLHRSRHTRSNEAQPMSDTLRSQIRDFILENYLFTNDTSAIDFYDSLLGRGIVDSTGMLEVIFFIEEQLGVKVKDEEMVPENLDSINKIAQFVEARRKAA
jgi:acyl carrier protein